MAGKAAGFEVTVARGGEVSMRHNGLPAATLREGDRLNVAALNVAESTRPQSSPMAPPVQPKG
ncbi:hypothetical protein [Arthrobacter dokdonensis]|uniref:hypothetical protein n=1 Tax=Arthrobacter dokdonellae TaxID=2211210 RepID=UPI001013CE1A|nr:hypothetical protein [Arthrobacter dokdonellae]